MGSMAHLAPRYSTSEASHVASSRFRITTKQELRETLEVPACDPLTQPRRSRPLTETGRKEQSEQETRQHGGQHEHSGWPVPLWGGAFRGDAQRRLQFGPTLHLLLLPNARRRRCHGGNGWD